jgi:hypothetical protein
LLESSIFLLFFCFLIAHQDCNSDGGFVSQLVDVGTLSLAAFSKADESACRGVAGCVLDEKQYQRNTFVVSDLAAEEWAELAPQIAIRPAVKRGILAKLAEEAGVTESSRKELADQTPSSVGEATHDVATCDKEKKSVARRRVWEENEKKKKNFLKKRRS